MKKLIIITFGLAVLLTACDKERLDLENPNEAPLENLKTESGFQKGSFGVYYALRAVDTPYGAFYYTWFIQWVHNIMGDATVSHVGNFGIRWANQTAKIIKPDGSEFLPPQGGRQHVELDNLNERDKLTDNVQAFEWFNAYALIGHCNFMLPQIGDVEFTGSDEVKLAKANTYKAWFYFWKGFAYSRLGSIYKQGIIVNEFNQLSNNYVSNQALLDEAARNFNLAKEVLAEIPEDNASYREIFTSLIPTHFRVGNGGFISPAALTRNINTYLARNILVNKYASELTTADLEAIETLANAGIASTDKIFTIRSASQNCLVYTTAWSAARLNSAWERVSERLVQDFKPEDARKAKNIRVRTAGAFLNPGGRGVQYANIHELVPMNSGGNFASSVAGQAEVPLACSYEENQLMLAESKIRRDMIEEGLAHIDAVRAFQNSGLPALVGTGLTKAEALEELRIERRIGLFLKNVAFYDARRWGVLKPLSQGGGRTNAMVLFTAAEGLVPCTIEYDYKEWWDVPKNETDFNTMSTSNVPPPFASSPN